MSEITITLEQYKLRDLNANYYRYLGILASLELSPESEWTKVYRDRLEEIKLEIQQNGGVINA